MALNRLPGDYPRDTTINIRVSKAERALIKRAAESRGISVSAYLIGLALGTTDQLGLDRRRGQGQG